MYLTLITIKKNIARTSLPKAPEQEKKQVLQFKLSVSSDLLRYVFISCYEENALRFNATTFGRYILRFSSWSQH